MLRVIISGQIRGPNGVITVYVSKKDSILSFLVEVRIRTISRNKNIDIETSILCEI